MNTKMKIISFSIATIMLSACAGGGGGSGTNSNTSPNTGTSPHAGTGSSNTTNQVGQNNSTMGVTSNNTSIDDVNRHNANLKQHHVSVEKQNANAAANSARSGDGASVILTDTGINKDAFSGLHQANIADTMTTKNGEVPTHDNNKFSHGAMMAKIMYDTAPNVRIKPADFSDAAALTDVVLSAYRAEAQNAQNKTKTIVLNNSYGADIFENPEYYYTDDANKLHQQLTKETNGKTGLFVISTGNKGVQNASITAQMPNIVPALKSNYIVVTGVDDKGNQVHNYCGVTKDYCIAAPAIAKVQMGNGRYGKSNGTSNAAAFVSATAAQVASNFDWANASQVKDMIFTTATAKGDSNRYGVGVINPEKALHGYGRFDNTVTLNVDGMKNAYYFDNDISGNGGLVKIGNKRLVLNGNNTYTGNTTVNAGDLMVNGKNVSNFTVNQGAQLTIGDNTHGISTGNVVNRGILSSETLADVTINGNLTTSGTIRKFIGSTINVTGNTSIQGGTLDVTGVAKQYVTRSGKRENLIVSQNVNGSFNNIVKSGNNLVNTQITQDSRGIYADVQRNTVGDAIRKDNAALIHSMSGDIKLFEDTLTVIDTKINNNQQVSVKEQGFIDLLLQTHLPVSYELFRNSIGTNVRNQENIARSMLVNAQNGLLNGSGAWVNFIHNSPVYKTSGVKSNGNENGLSIGYTGNHSHGKWFVSATHNHSRLSENVDSVNKTVSGSSTGVDGGYMYHLKNMDVFTNIGIDRISLTNDGGKGYQYRVGTGVSKTFSFDKWSVTPMFGMYYSYSKLNDIVVSDNVFTDDNRYQLLVAKLGANGIYALSDKVYLTGNVSIQQDLMNKHHSSNVVAGNFISLSQNLKNETTGSINVGVMGKLHNGLSINAKVGFDKSNRWSNKSATFGVNWQF